MVTVSPPVSPRVVAAILMIQKTRVTSGTLVAYCSNSRVMVSLTMWDASVFVGNGGRAGVTRLRQQRASRASAHGRYCRASAGRGAQNADRAGSVFAARLLTRAIFARAHITGPGIAPCNALPEFAPHRSSHPA